MSISSHGFFNGVRGKPSERRKVTSSLSRRFCLAASRDTASASSTVSFTFFFFVLFSFSLPPIECRNAYPMMPEPQQKSMTRFGGFLVSPYTSSLRRAEEDLSSSKIESRRKEVMISKPPLAKKPG